MITSQSTPAFCPCRCTRTTYLVTTVHGDATIGKLLQLRKISFNSSATSFLLPLVSIRHQAIAHDGS